MGKRGIILWALLTVFLVLDDNDQNLMGKYVQYSIIIVHFCACHVFHWALHDGYGNPFHLPLDSWVTVIVVDDFVAPDDMSAEEEEEDDDDSDKNQDSDFQIDSMEDSGSDWEMSQKSKVRWNEIH